MHDMLLYFLGRYKQHNMLIFFRFFLKSFFFLGGGEGIRGDKALWKEMPILSFNTGINFNDKLLCSKLNGILQTTLI